MSNEEVKLSDSNSEAFDALVFAYLDGILDDYGRHSLRTCLQKSYYIQRFVEICQEDQLLREAVGVDIYEAESLSPWLVAETSDLSSHLLLQELAEFERSAPAIEIPRKKPPRQLINKVIYTPSEKRKVSKLTIATFFFSAAAILLMILLPHFAVDRNMYEYDAVLTDIINGSFADESEQKEIGSSLSSNEGAYWLQCGFVKLLFGNGAEVVIEAPARFEILSGSEMNLLRGQAYATVPKRATGFTVYTPDSRVIDLGTEFGVSVKPSNSEIHVIKGKTQLVPEGDVRSRRPIELVAGRANQIDKNGLVKDIGLDTQQFVSDISSKMGLVYRDGKSFPIGQWGKRLQVDPTTDLRTDGLLVHAINFGFQAKSVTVAGIPFEPDSASVLVSGGKNVELTNNPFYSGSDASLLGLLGKSRQINNKKNTRIEITMNQLEAGQLYRIQLIIGFERKWYNLNCYGVSREYMYFPNSEKPGLGLATYIWKPQSSSEAITLTSPEDGRNVVHIFGYVMHKIDRANIRPDAKE